MDERCAECGKALTPDDRVVAGDRTFCRTCYAALAQQLDVAVRAMSEDIPYPQALIGALLGGAVGVALWVTVTVVTHWSIGLIAVALGWAVGFGTVRFAGGKRSRNLQFMAALVALASWVVASYLVNMTFVNRALAAQGETGRVPVVPTSFEMFGRVISAGFGMMDMVFLAIMVWEAWKMPRPLVLRTPAP